MKTRRARRTRPPLRSPDRSFIPMTVAPSSWREDVTAALDALDDHGECSGCGQTIRRPNVGGRCKACIVAEWVQGDRPDSLPEVFDR